MAETPVSTATSLAAEGKAGLTGECGHVEAEQAELAKLARELAAEKAKVVELKGDSENTTGHPRLIFN